MSRSVERQGQQWPHRFAALQFPPGLYWRGLSDQEWQNAQRNGFLQSNNSRVIPGQEGLTFFSADPHGAANLVRNSQSLGYAMHGPLHLVGIPMRKPDHEYPAPEFQRPGDYHEVGFRQPIPITDIAHHYLFQEGRWGPHPTSHRTAMPWTPEEARAIRQDKSHPHYWDVPHDPQGLPVSTPEEKENRTPEYLHRGIRVKGPVRAHHLQSLLQAGIGQHWTSDIQNAAAFGDPDNHDEDDDYPGAANYPGPKGVGLIFTIRHPGAQHVVTNPDGDHVNDSYWDDEHEHTLAPGAPIEVTQVHMKDLSRGHQWIPCALPPRADGRHRT